MTSTDHASVERATATGRATGRQHRDTVRAKNRAFTPNFYMRN